MSTPQSVAERAVLAVGCGYDLSDDIRLEKCKTGYDLSDDIRLEKCSRLVDVGGGGREVVVPGGVVVRDVPWSIRCEKGERMRFRSDVLSFHQMSEHFNQSMSLPCKIPSGLFNAMFDFQGCWQKDACGTKSLLFDGWFITLYSIELMRSEMVLLDSVKNDVPSRWDPAALTKFIEKYGTHIVTGVKMGGKDVIHLKQLHTSSLGTNEMQVMTKKLAYEVFSEDATEDVNGRIAMDLHELCKESKECHGFVMKSIGPSVVSRSKEHGVVTVHVRRGGTDYIQSHKQWLSTVPMAPDVILMSFIPITSFLNGVPGSGFLSHAINHYLHYKPPIEELHQFLEFQLPRQWAPLFGDLPLGPRPKKQKFPSLRFSLMGPKLCINTEQVCSGNRPVTGIRLYLEGMKNDCLAIHLQHLSAFPDTLQFTNDNNNDLHNEEMSRKDYYVPIRCLLFSHVCTAPVQYSKACIDDSACIVTKAWLEVREIGVKQVLFLRLGFSAVASAKIRRSEWDGSSSFSRKSGFLSALIGTRFSIGYNSPPMLAEVELNSALYPHGPPVPVRLPKMSEFIDTTETMRGPEDPPGYWLVTGAKLCIENGKILVKAKYSLLSLLP